MRSHRRTLYALALICAGALIFRILLMAAFVRFPGIADPNHYYNMGVRLAVGQGFTTNYIWNYNNPPNSIVHPEDHWMPLAAVLAAVPMSLFGVSVSAALIPFLLVGSCLPLLAFWAARQMHLAESSALFAAGAAALIPELVLNSVRTDTTIPTALFVCLCLLMLTEGLRRGGAGWYVGAGAMAGFAYLTRNDALLLIPLVLALLVVTWFARRGDSSIPFHPRWAILFPVAMLVVMSPWLIRNWQTFGAFGSPETDDMFFFTDHLDHYAYGRHFTLETMLAAQTPTQILGKRLFEMAAGIKVMIEGFGGFLAVAFLGGIGLLTVNRREKERWLAAAPALILLIGVFIAYTVFIPYKAQAGSFKKAFLMLLPLLLPVAAYALETALTDKRIRYGTMVIALALLGLSAFDLVRLDAQKANAYAASIRLVADAANELPDANADGEIVLMTQDPYVVSYYGIPALMYPHEDRETVYEIARRYGVDYLLMPSDRAPLDGLLHGESDPRFVYGSAVNGTQYQFFRVEYPLSAP
jgi:hypothetical protein